MWHKINGNTKPNKYQRVLVSGKDASGKSVVHIMTAHINSNNHLSFTSDYKTGLVTLDYWAKLPLSPNEKPENDKEQRDKEMYKLWKTGVSGAEIGRRFGLSGNQVLKICHKLHDRKVGDA